MPISPFRKENIKPEALAVVKKMRMSAKTNAEIAKTLKTKGFKKLLTGQWFSAPEISRICIDLLKMRKTAPYRTQKSNRTARKVAVSIDTLTLLEDILTSNLAKEAKQTIVNKLMVNGV